MELCQADVLALFEVDAAAGTLRWRSGRFEGRLAGTVRTDGYVVIQINGRKHFAHRVIWLCQFGAWPSLNLDHRNGIRCDNRIANLRDISQKLNTQNRRPNRTLANRFMGVVKNSHGRPYGARIKVDGKTTYLGQFDTQEQAHAAYMKAKRALHAGCAY